MPEDMPEEQIAPYDFNTSTSRNLPPELSAQPFDKRPIYIGVGVVVVFLALVIGLAWFLFIHPEAAEILRDISIIYIALGLLVLIPMVMVLLVITAYLVLKVNDIAYLLDREIRPLLANTQETLGTVKGTTSFISEQAVRPVITTATSVAAAKAIMRSLFRQD